MRAAMFMAKVRASISIAQAGRRLLALHLGLEMGLFLPDSAVFAKAYHFQKRLKVEARTD
jgi:hypothetical protein